MLPLRLACMSAAGRPVCFIHGRHDIVATPKFGEQQAKRLAAPFMLLDAGHFVPREQAQEVRAARERGRAPQRRRRGTQQQLWCGVVWCGGFCPLHAATRGRTIGVCTRGGVVRGTG